MAKTPKSCTQNLEFWMTNLPQRLRTTPLIYLTIPGSHDSTSYAIKRTSELAPDIHETYKRFRFLGPILRAFVASWARTQSADVTQQLANGIRYFDLRIATKAGADGFYFVHLLYSAKINQVLEQIRDFLDAHPQEVVILDCQHVYVTQQMEHERLIQIFAATFGPKMAPYNRDMEELTLDCLSRANRQVLLVYRYGEAMEGHRLLWPSGCLPTPWPDTVSAPKLFEFLNDKLRERDYSVGYVSQCVLTPNSSFIWRHFFGSLKNNLSIPLHRDKCEWLKGQKPGQGGINVVISDFVDYQDYQFSKVVIGLNRKLLEVVFRGEN
ncbi:PI-PLC-X domain containing protein [Asbolus verrucosus]|uniref:PI-PLC-X domain containing protein n=1 Tax=Asbolus verrucosus TaxID=1661398 RepID=A0A482VS26_ASBVE|nr:PI-PLC-X domain containing protein [Asbolus verrucosus]